MNKILDNATWINIHWLPVSTCTSIKFIPLKIINELNNKQKKHFCKRGTTYAVILEVTKGRNS